MAGNGKDTDFWILNALRGICDAAIIGGNSMRTDADYCMHCMDEEIQKDRVAVKYCNDTGCDGCSDGT